MSERKVTKIFLMLAIISTLVFSAWGVVRTVKCIQFDTNCTQYLRRAADASTIENAKEELKKAISYLEENDLTEGIVSIFFQQPQNDVGFWYKNMSESYSELESLPKDATSLEKSNVLMKLRGTLTDDDGATVTVPEGISIYPNNVSYFWWGMISFSLTFIFWMIIMMLSI